MENIEMVSSSNLVCVVCHLKTNTLAELHRHQTFLHTTEELSLAALSQQSTFMNNEFLTKNSTLGSTLNPYKSSGFYYLSARLLDDNNNSLGFDRSVPLDYVKQKKDSVRLKSQSPKAGLVETRRKNNFIRRQQYRRNGILRALNAGVLDLSLPKKTGNSKTKSCHLIENIFYLENEETKTYLDGKKNKKAPKKTTKKRNLLDNVSPIKMEPLFLEDGDGEEKIEIPASPGTEVCPRDVPSGSQAIALKNEQIEVLIGEDESCNIHKNNQEDNKMEEYFPLDACSPSIPLDGLNYSLKPEVVYALQDEQNEKPTGGGTKNARKGKQSSASPGKGIKTLKKTKKSSSKDEKKKNTGNKKCKKSETVKNVNDNTCLDMPQGHEENVAEKAPDDRVKLPDEGEEFFTNEFSDLSNDRVNLQSDHFEGVTEFPTYPNDMDEYSILVFDPDSRGLVWSSFELVDDARSPNIDERPQDIQKDIELEIGDTTLKNNCRNILFDCLTAAKPQQEKNPYYKREPRAVEASLAIKDTSTDSFCFQRSKRRRTMPDRYVPL